jgi:hypothetical protein
MSYGQRRHEDDEPTPKSKADSLPLVTQLKTSQLLEEFERHCNPKIPGYTDMNRKWAVAAEIDKRIPVPVAEFLPCEHWAGEGPPRAFCPHCPNGNRNPEYKTHA